MSENLMALLLKSSPLHFIFTNGVPGAKIYDLIVYLTYSL